MTTKKICIEICQTLLLTMHKQVNFSEATNPVRTGAPPATTPAAAPTPPPRGTSPTQVLATLKFGYVIIG